MKYIIILSLILQGCGGGSGTAETQAKPTYVGDSLCARDGSPAKILGWLQDCQGGRKLIEVNELPKGKVYLGLGTNDNYRGVDILLFEHHLISLLDSATESVTCVLPTINKYDSTQYRDVLIRLCDDFIDPHDSGVYGLLDGVHMTEQENYNLAQSLLNHYEL
tara:strand:- start:40 stop:528 length:489 start_codon:yes stop_codon:yes gene_type:complete